jgi:glycosyltransferase involved in cell wall biosynthesis
MLLGWNGLGGTQSQAFRLSAELQARGINVFVLTRHEPGLSRHETLEGVEVQRVGWRARGGLRALAFLGGVLVWMLRHRRTFQIIHAHNLPAALTAALVGPLLGKPVVAKLPNAVTVEIFSRRRFGALRWVVLRRFVTRFIALHAEIEGRLWAKGVAAARIVRIPNGVGAPAARAAAETASARSSWGIAPDTPTVIYLGRLIPDKGLAWLLHAWADVVGQARGHLLVAGDGPDDALLRALADQLAIAGSVSFLGYRTDVEPLLAMADILVLPSRSEGMSNALLEGMAHGLAVVATDGPGNRAVVEHGREGLLVAFDDRRALSEALLSLVRDSTLRRRLGEAASRRTEAEFSIRVVADAHEGVYRALAAPRVPRPRLNPGPTTTSVSRT